MFSVIYHTISYHIIMHCIICYNVVYLCVSLSVTICIQTAVGAHHVDNAHLAEKVVELEGHLQALRMEMDQKSEVINSLRKQLVSSQHDKAIADRELRKLCNVFNFRVFYNKNFQIVLYYHFSIVTEHFCKVFFANLRYMFCAELQRRRAADMRAENVLLQQCTREQDLVQRELELEVRALVAGGADMAARVDAAANEKAAQVH
jgi:hypothetical protein